MQILRDDEKLFAALGDLDRAVQALAMLQTHAPFETIIRVTADFGMRVEAALTPREAERLRASLPLLDKDASGKAMRRIKFYDGRFTLEWPFHKHTYEKGGAV